MVNPELHIHVDVILGSPKLVPNMQFCSKEDPMENRTRPE